MYLYIYMYFLKLIRFLIEDHTQVNMLQLR